MHDAAPAAPPTVLDRALDDAIDSALDGLLHALRLESVDDNRFRVAGEPGRFDRVFGGQTVAQALLAASATAPGKTPHSLHAYFVEAGAVERPIDLAVDHVRDGRSFATRKVSVNQAERTLLTAIVSFQSSNPDEPLVAEAPPAVPPPARTRLLQEWVELLPPDQQATARTWVDSPPPLELRVGEPPSFLSGQMAADLIGTRSHWMRYRRPIGPDPLLHLALLSYASDYLLLDMAQRAYPLPLSRDSMRFSLDHAIWFHQPVHADQWHLYTQQVVAISGHRALVRGAIHDDEGRLAASVAQEVLLRPR